MDTIWLQTANVHSVIFHVWNAMDLILWQIVNLVQINIHFINISVLVVIQVLALSLAKLVQRVQINVVHALTAIQSKMTLVYNAQMVVCNAIRNSNAQSVLMVHTWHWMGHALPAILLVLLVKDFLYSALVVNLDNTWILRIENVVIEFNAQL
jgi:hypothetical protein